MPLKSNIVIQKPSSSIISNGLGALEAAYLVTIVTSTSYSRRDSLTRRFKSVLNSSENALLQYGEVTGLV